MYLLGRVAVTSSSLLLSHCLMVDVGQSPDPPSGQQPKSLSTRTSTSRCTLDKNHLYSSSTSTAPPSSALAPGGATPIIDDDNRRRSPPPQSPPQPTRRVPVTWTPPRTIARLSSRPASRAAPPRSRSHLSRSTRTNRPSPPSPASHRPRGPRLISTRSRLAAAPRPSRTSFPSRGASPS